MTHEVNYLVFDILGDLCFGKQFNMKEPDSDLKHIPELMASFLETLAPVSSVPCHIHMLLPPIQFFSKGRSHWHHHVYSVLCLPIVPLREPEPVR